MLKRLMLGAVCGAALLGNGLAYAQASATLTLRSGESVNGQLIDLGGVGFTIRVNGADRRIAQNDVAVIDFTGGTMSDADWAKFAGSPQVVLRNGQTINGSLDDIGGTSPLRLTVKTASGQQDLSSNDVARIIVARPANATPAPAATPQPAQPGAPGAQPAPARGGRRGTSDNTPVPTGGYQPDAPAGGYNAGGAESRHGGRNNNQSGGAFTVPANQPWTSTGISVQRGQTLRFSTTGRIELSGNGRDTATADGARNSRYVGNGPMREVPAGALIGRIGNGAPFVIGSQTSIVAPGTGLLLLGINDNNLGDNSGSFQVVIR